MQGTNSHKKIISGVKVDRFSRAAECQEQQPRQRLKSEQTKLVKVIIHEVVISVLSFEF